MQLDATLDTTATHTVGSPGEREPRMPSLSPSRAADFKTCPLLYRFRTIDRLPERPSMDQVRGTLVHAVLDALFDLPAPQRTPEAAAALVGPAWQRLLDPDGELASAVGARPRGTIHPRSGEPITADPQGAPAGSEPVVVDPVEAARIAQLITEMVLAELPTEEFLASARELLDGYFAVEDPRRLEPAERESLVQADIEGLRIRGYVDRLDISPSGDLRVVDYKTGGAPREAFEARALFQLKFYALVLWKTRGVVPRMLRLLYLKDAEVCDFAPDEQELARFERTLLALWQAIDRATAERDFRPKPSRLCGWCSHQALCPAFGGTPPPYPLPPGEAGAAAIADCPTPPSG